MSTRSQRYGIPEKMGYMTGILKGHWKGYGFVDAINPELPSVYIPANAMRSAFHLDKVLVRIKESAGDDHKAEGEVVAVLERGVTELPGTFENQRNLALLYQMIHDLTPIFLFPATGQKVSPMAIKWFVVSPNGRKTGGTQRVKSLKSWAIHQIRKQT